MNEQWLWVSLYYATYGIAHDGTYITDAAPIARWMVGKTKEEVVEWLKRKDPEVKIVEV